MTQTIQIFYVILHQLATITMHFNHILANECIQASAQHETPQNFHWELLQELDQINCMRVFGCFPGQTQEMTQTNTEQ